MLEMCQQSKWPIPNPCSEGLTSCTNILWILVLWKEFINKRKGFKTWTTWFCMFYPMNWKSPSKSWVSLESSAKQFVQNWHTSDMKATRTFESNQYPLLWSNTHCWTMGPKISTTI
jgi:hypothetical protein